MTLCVKTPKGLEEVAKRSDAVPQKARRLLILVDGSRDFATIAKMFPADDTLATLEKLLADGYITPRVIDAPKAAEPTAPAAPAVALPQVEPGQRYEMARNFMLNTTSAFLGVFGSSLSEKIEAATCLEDLQELYIAWRDAIRLTPDGKKRADELETRLASLLS